MPEVFLSSCNGARSRIRVFQQTVHKFRQTGFSLHLFRRFLGIVDVVANLSGRRQPLDLLKKVSRTGSWPHERATDWIGSTLIRRSHERSGCSRIPLHGQAGIRFFARPKWAAHERRNCHPNRHSSGFRLASTQLSTTMPYPPYWLPWRTSYINFAGNCFTKAAVRASAIT